MNNSTREIIEHEIRKLDIAIDNGKTDLAGAKVRVARIEADLAATRTRRAELQQDLHGSHGIEYHDGTFWKRLIVQSHANHDGPCGCHLQGNGDEAAR